MGQQPLQFLTSTRGVYYEKLRNEKLEKLRISVSKKKRRKEKERENKKKKRNTIERAKLRRFKFTFDVFTIETWAKNHSAWSN